MINPGKRQMVFEVIIAAVYVFGVQAIERVETRSTLKWIKGWKWTASKIDINT